MFLSDRSFWTGLWTGRKMVLSFGVPLVLLPLPLFYSAGGDSSLDAISNSSTASCGYVLLVMAIFWLTEAVPLAITALLPIVLFPLMGVLSSEKTCLAYMKETVMIFLGSLIAAAAVEHSNLHQRIALKVLLMFGTSPKWLLLGFMLNTMFLSMWISNTAATALMIPIVDAVLVQLRHRTKSFSANPRKYPEVDSEAFLRMKRSIYLGICYSANIGGTGTMTGTTPNLILVGIISKMPNAELSFSTWIFFNVPGMLICVFLAWLFVVLVFVRRSTESVDNLGGNPAITGLIKRKYQLLGPMTFHEHSVLWLFVLLILLWFFRAPEFIKGWSISLHPNKTVEFVRDSCPAMLIVVLYYMIPADPRNFATSPALLDWKTTQQKVAWNVVLLLGGGFALSAGAEESGLSTLLGNSLKAGLQGVDVFWLVLILCLIALVMTEIASNSATATILLGVIKELAESMGLNGLKLMLPVTICCSYAFLLPVASPPNAIIFEAAEMRTKDMAIPGIVMKLVCLVVIIFMINVWGPVVFDFPSPLSNVTTTNLINQTISSTVAF